MRFDVLLRERIVEVDACGVQLIFGKYGFDYIRSKSKHTYYTETIKLLYPIGKINTPFF